MVEKTLDTSAPAPELEPTQPTWRLVDVLLITVASVTFLLIGIVIFRSLRLNTLDLSLASVGLEAIVLVGCVSLLGLRRKGLPWQAVGIRPAPSRWEWAAVGAGILCLFLTGLVALLVDVLLGRPLTNPQIPFLIPQGLTPLAEVVMFVLAGLAVPFAEELYFRGVLYVWLRQRFGFGVGAVVSAIIFGAAHGDIALAAGIAVMGFIQAWVFERSRSLWTTFTIHALNNSVKLILLYAVLASGIPLN